MKYSHLQDHEEKRERIWINERENSSFKEAKERWEHKWVSQGMGKDLIFEC